MNWKKIDNSNRIQKEGIYSEWKQDISDDCYNQCVYCSIHESPWGGIDHYHIDHFKPKSLFKDLENTVTNLYYSCPICNRFKSNDWKYEPYDLNSVCYPDPAEYNYSDLFILNEENFTLEGKYVAAKYLINRLFLNRPQLIYERREYFLKRKAEELILSTYKLLEEYEDVQQIKEAYSIIKDLYLHLSKRDKVRPYKLIDIQKTKKQ